MDIKGAHERLEGRIYRSRDKTSAPEALGAFGKKRDKKYANITKSLRKNWVSISAYFKYPYEIRKLIL